MVIDPRWHAELTSRPPDTDPRRTTQASSWEEQEKSPHPHANSPHPLLPPPPNCPTHLPAPSGGQCADGPAHRRHGGHREHEAPHSGEAAAAPGGGVGQEEWDRGSGTGGVGQEEWGGGVYGLEPNAKGIGAGFGAAWEQRHSVF